MRPAPEACGNHQRIDPLAIPPGALVAPPVEFTVVQPANGNGECLTLKWFLMLGGALKF